MIAYFPRHKWYNRFAGLVVVIGLVWYYLAPVGSNTVTLVFAGLFVITLVIGLVIRRMEGPEEGRGPRVKTGRQSRFTRMTAGTGTSAVSDGCTIHGVVRTRMLGLALPYRADDPVRCTRGGPLLAYRGTGEFISSGWSMYKATAVIGNVISMLVLAGCAWEAQANPSSTVTAPADANPGDTVCVVGHGPVRLAAAKYDSVARTWLVDGSPDSLAYRPASPPYVDSKEWFDRKQAIQYRGHRFQMYALPVVWLPAEVKRLAEFDGVALYAEAALGRDVENPGIIYAPLSPGCQYQPYYYFDETGPVRGG